MPTLSELASIQPTPRNPAWGAISDFLRYIDQNALQKQFGYANPVTGAISEAIGVPAASRVAERLSYGQPITNVGKANVPLIPEDTAEAAMFAAPIAGKYGKFAGKEAARLIDKAIIEGQGPLAGITPRPMRIAEDFSYRGSHTAPGPDFGAPLHDLTGGGQMYPSDVYAASASRIYGGGMPYDRKAFDIAQSYKDKPNAFVTIYRAVPKELSNSEKLATLEKQMAAYMKRGTLPKDAENYSSGSKWYDWAYEQRDKLRELPDEPMAQIGINPGDWVTLTKEYAKEHGESALKGQYKIISKKVKAKDLWTNADSIHEFGYHPSND